MCERGQRTLPSGSLGAFGGRETAVPDVSYCSSEHRRLGGSLEGADCIRMAIVKAQCVSHGCEGRRVALCLDAQPSPGLLLILPSCCLRVEDPSGALGQASETPGT